MKSLIPALFTALTSAQCTLSTAGLETEAKFDAIIGDFETFFLFAMGTNMHKQNVKKKSRKHAHKQCQKSIKLPARIAASGSQSIKNFESLCGLRLTQTCLRAKHEEKTALNEENENQ